MTLALLIPGVGMGGGAASAGGATDTLKTQQGAGG
jgi:hypothetical protein